MSNQQNPGEGFSLPYQALRKSMLGYLRKQVSDPAVAEDLLQDVFLKAIAAGERGHAPRNLSGWLYKIARNTVIDYYRAKRPSEMLPSDLTTDDTDENPVEQSLSKCLRPFTEELPPFYRDALLATDFSGRPMRQLAEEWDVSVSAVKSRASRGRKMLKMKLLECCRVNLSVTGKVLDIQKNSKADSCEESGGCA